MVIPADLVEVIEEVVADVGYVVSEMPVCFPWLEGLFAFAFEAWVG